MLKPSKLFTLFAIFLLTVLCCLSLQSCVYVQPNNTKSNNLAFIEVEKIKDGRDEVVILKAVIRAPSGTTVFDTFLGDTTLTSDRDEYLIISKMYSKVEHYLDTETQLANASIESSVYTPWYSAVNNIEVIPKSGPRPQHPIEHYAYFASSGTYPLKAGEPFVLAEIGDTVYQTYVIE